MWKETLDCEASHFRYYLINLNWHFLVCLFYSSSLQFCTALFSKFWVISSEKGTGYYLKKYILIKDCLGGMLPLSDDLFFNTSLFLSHDRCLMLCREVHPCPTGSMHLGDTADLGSRKSCLSSHCKMKLFLLFLLSLRVRWYFEKNLCTWESTSYKNWFKHLFSHSLSFS